MVTLWIVTQWLVCLRRDLMPILITTAEAKTHLRVYHTEDDVYIASLVQSACDEWEAVTHSAIGQLTIPTAQSHYIKEPPSDGYFRVYFNPVNVAIQPVITMEDPVATITPTEAWQTLDGFSIYPIGTSLTTNSNYSYPLTFSYTLLPTLVSTVKQAILLRVGYFYSYRGDDVSPPNMEGWKMLVARYRTGALL